MIVEVLWPVGWIYATHTVEAVRITERTLLGAVKRYSRSFGFSRPGWVPLVGGGPRRFTCVAQGRRGTDASEVTLEIDIPHGRHALLTCWPEKRRGVTPARAETSWELKILDA